MKVLTLTQPTCDAVHGHQQLSLFNAHHDKRCFMPIHVYHVGGGRLVAVLLRPGKTPSGATATTAGLRRWRGASNGVDYIFGLAGNAVLHALADEIADDTELRHAETGAKKIRGFASFDYAAGWWNRLRRMISRLEATARGFDARYIVTSLEGEPHHLYEGVYCARGQTVRKTSSSSTRPSSPPTGPPARARSPTSSAWCSLQAARQSGPSLDKPMHCPHVPVRHEPLAELVIDDFGSGEPIPPPKPTPDRTCCPVMPALDLRNALRAKEGECGCKQGSGRVFRGRHRRRSSSPAR